jgi:hypothetical protein
LYTHRENKAAKLNPSHKNTFYFDQRWQMFCEAVGFNGWERGEDLT